jgi:hypothetical protein
MKTPMIASSLAFLALLACSAPGRSTTAAAAPDTGEIRWQVEPDTGRGDAPRLRLNHRTSTNDMALDDPLVRSRPEFTAARSALGGGAGAVTFRVVHEAGTLDCSGTLAHAYEGKGRCRFAPDAGFERELADRGLAPAKRSDLLAMLMVDATLALADGLAREGVKPVDSGDLIGAAALGVTPDYVRDLKVASMKLTSIGDAIACRALGVDGPYVRELADAGYTDLSSDDVVGMKALGVTGAYAKAMNRMAGAAR